MEGTGNVEDFQDIARGHKAALVIKRFSFLIVSCLFMPCQWSVKFQHVTFMDVCFTNN